MQRFGALSNDELNELIKVPMFVGLLIGYADGSLDEREEEWIEKVTLFRTKNAHHTLRPYYVEAHKYIQDNMKLYIRELPENNEEKLKILSRNIEASKPILAKLPVRLRERLIDSYQSMALSVAEISGGVLNFFSLNADEEKWINWMEFQVFEDDAEA